MPSKKVIAIIIISIVTAGTLISLIPVFIYGLKVDALSIDSGLGVAGSPAMADFESSTIFTINARAVEISPYEYMFRGTVKTGGNSGFPLIDLMSLDIYFYINISTPNVNFYELVFTLEDLLNILTQDTNILLGPDEIEIVSGTYEVWVNLVVSISIPDIFYNETFESGVFYFVIDVVVE